jgi:nicotinamide mononucleotide adenylyltransferase
LIKDSEQSHVAFLSMTEPKMFEEASQDDGWIRAMNEELDQIEKNNTWELVPRPEDKNVIGSKWVFKNKMNEKVQVVRNNPNWFEKDTHKLKVRTLMKLLHQWQDWKPSECFLLIHVIKTLKFIRWMLSHHFLMEI